MFISPRLLCTLTPLLLGTSALARPSHAKRGLDVPDYALTYAPWVHLYSEERWFPSDLNTHLSHCTAFIDTENAPGQPVPMTIETVDFDNVANMYVTSNDNVEGNPAWLSSTYAKPDASAKSAGATIIVLVDKSDSVGPGIVDVFYFMFYSYNHGSEFQGKIYGNHVGDWENILVRFNNSQPDSVFLSAHSGGGGYKYSAVEKKGVRAVFYSATGTHANYAIIGSHDYRLPLGILKDKTNAGPLWDLAANYRAFWWSDANGFTPANGNDWSTHFLDYTGHWGDKQYPTSDQRQYCVVDECHYDDGPTGPVAKDLNRANICGSDECDTATSL